MNIEDVLKELAEVKEEKVTADVLIEDAIGMLSNIMAEDNTRDGDPPTGEEITRWVDEWLENASEYYFGENNA